MIRLGSVALVAAITPLLAQAADLPTRPPQRVMFEPTPVLNWTGFYAGGMVGGVWGQTGSDPSSGKDVFCVATVGSAPCNQTAYTNAPHSVGSTGSSSSVIGGGQVGYNYQVSRDFFVGAAADFMLMGRGRSAHYQTALDSFQTTSVDQSTRSDWLSTLRLRVGFVSDYLAIFATGGLAVADLRSTTSNLVTTTAYAPTTPLATLLSGRGSTSGPSLGWTLGGGFEYLFADNWGFGLEYLYYRVNRTYGVTVTQVDPPAAPYSYNMKATSAGSIVRAGVNYHF